MHVCAYVRDWGGNTERGRERERESECMKEKEHTAALAREKYTWPE